MLFHQVLLHELIEVSKLTDSPCSELWLAEMLLQ